LMAVAGESAEIIRAANAGLTCTPENPQSIANAVRELYFMSKDQRSQYAADGQRYYYDHMSFSMGIEKILKVYGEAYAQKNL
jgi:colanic acid biosynthesis glycosyl transferase WcaI